MILCYKTLRLKVILMIMQKKNVMTFNEKTLCRKKVNVIHA